MKTIDLRTPGPSGDTGAGTGPGAGRLILLDVPAELVDRFESGSGGTLTIRGREDDTAVLVTSDSTYAVRSVSQSNSLLLCHATNAATLSIAANVAEYMELVPTVPRLERIHSLLRDSRYTGDDTKLHGPDVVSYERLAREVQASDAQLATGLVQAHVVHLDGAMRQLDPEFTQTLLRALLAHIDLNAYLPSSVPVDETVAALEREHALNPTVTRAVLTSFFGSSADAETDSAALDLPAVARFFGIQCLKRARVSLFPRPPRARECLKLIRYGACLLPAPGPAQRLCHKLERHAPRTRSRPLPPAWRVHPPPRTTSRPNPHPAIRQG